MRYWLPKTQVGRLFQIYCYLQAAMMFVIADRPKGMTGLSVDKDYLALKYQKTIQPQMRVIETYLMHSDGQFEIPKVWHNHLFNNK